MNGYATGRARAARGSGLGRTRALLALALLASLTVFATPVAAAEPTVTAPRATVEFLDSITFRGEAVLTPEVVRVEIVIRIEGSERAFVSTIPTIPEGRDEMAYVLETPGGAYMPNTTLRAHFRITKADGSTVESRVTTVDYVDTRIDWNTMVGDFVTVHWTEGGQAFGQRAVDIADAAVREVSDLLGVVEADPIDFYIYADRAAFLDVLGPASRESVGGQAHADIRTLFANIAPSAIDDPWVGIVIPHELTHLVFDTAVGNDYHFPPRWLNEGIAVYLSEGYVLEDRRATEAAADGGTLMPLRALTGQFPTTAVQFRLAYSESASAVDFLVREHGQPAMVELVRSYADGVTDDEAFETALGTDVAGFEAAWLQSLGADEPIPYGPVDAPPGPVPADWRDGEIPVDSPGPASAAPTRAPGTGVDPGSGDGSAWLIAILGGGLAIAILGLALRRRNPMVPAAAPPGALPAGSPPRATEAGPWAATPTPAPGTTDPPPEPGAAPSDETAAALGGVQPGPDETAPDR